MKSIRNQRGALAAVLALVIAVIIGLVAYEGYFARKDQSLKQPKQDDSGQSESAQSVSDTTADKQPEIVKGDDPYAVVSSKSTSPDGVSKVTQNEMLGDAFSYTLTVNGKVVSNRLPTASQYDAMVTKKKIRGQLAIHFKGWKSDSVFVWKIVNGYGEEFEYLVNGRAGEPNLASFRQTKKVAE